MLNSATRQYQARSQQAQSLRRSSTNQSIASVLQRDHLNEDRLSRRYSIANKIQFHDNRGTHVHENFSSSDEETDAAHPSLHTSPITSRRPTIFHNPKASIFHTDGLSDEDLLQCAASFEADELPKTINHTAKNKPWFIFLPYGGFRTGWDVSMAWVLAFVSFYVPFRVCLFWDDDTQSDSIFWLELLIDVTFSVDILLNFTTAYVDKSSNELITKPSKIAVHYMKGSLLIDLVATLPFKYILTDSSFVGANNISKLGKLPKFIKFLRVMRLLKLLRVYKLQKFILRLEVSYNIHHGISRMIKIIIMVLMATHLVGCFWCLVGSSSGSNESDGGWVSRYSYEEKSTGIRYVAALYWAFSTLTTVGYGDISARTPQEQVYSMVMMLLGVSWYAYIVSSMSTIMASFDAQSKAVREKMICVNEFVRTGKFPPAIAKRIRTYFEYKLSNSHRALLMSCQYDADELLDELSSSLRADVLLFVERELISKIKFFENKPPQFVADAVTMLQPVVYQEGDSIVTEGSQADEMYFLTKGRAAVYYNDEKVSILPEGSYFGEIGCIMGGVRRASVKAIAVCELQALGRRNLNFLLSEYPAVAFELKTTAIQRSQVKKRLTQENLPFNINQGEKHEPKSQKSAGINDKNGSTHHCPSKPASEVIDSILTSTKIDSLINCDIILQNLLSRLEKRMLVFGADLEINAT